MSGGGPPHQSHNRHVPPANTAWNHLQVPSYFPRQPQVAHMQSEHPLLHQPTWHTPTTTDAMKMMPHTHMLSEMLKNEALFPRDCVDLSLARNGNQNGDLPTTPISLSVRDTNKINSLPPNVLEIQAMELTKCGSPNLKSAVSPGTIRAASMSPVLKSASPGLKSSSPGLKSHSPGRKSISPGPKSASPGINFAGGILSTVPVTMPNLPPGLSCTDVGKNQKRSNVRVDSILERLNSFPEKAGPPYLEPKHEYPSTTTLPVERQQIEVLKVDKIPVEKPLSQSHSSVIVQSASSYDENSNSSGINVPTPTNLKEDDSGSMHSNEDSLDSTKSRRKRKPSKTVRVNKEEDDVKLELEKQPAEASSIDHQSYDEPDTKTPSEHTQKLPEHTVSQAPVPPPPPPINPNPPFAHSAPPHPYQSDPLTIASILEGKANVETLSERRRSSDDVDAFISAAKTRRKHSSSDAAETIDDIAAMVLEGVKAAETLDDITAMVQEGLKEKERKAEGVGGVVSVKGGDVKRAESVLKISQAASGSAQTKPVTVSVIKTKENLEETLTSPKIDSSVAKSIPPATQPVAPSPVMTPAQKKATNTHFVEVEKGLEEMFAGIVEDNVPAPVSSVSPVQAKSDSLLGLTDSLLKLDDSVTSTTSQEVSTSQKAVATAQQVAPSETNEEPATAPNDVKGEEKKPVAKKARRSRPVSRRDSHTDGESPPKKKRFTKTKGSASTTAAKKVRSPTTASTSKSPKKISSSPVTSNKIPIKSSTIDIKDVYAYDSGSNASSSRSRGPFVQIRGHRDSPLSVSIVNTPLTGDEDGEKKPIKSKKFHDDSEYRHKVRSKGLHCSTLSNKYDAERKDTSWICAFCKRGPHASELTGPSIISNVPPPGDLFGPYFITTQCPEFERRLDDPYDRQFKSRKITKALDAAGGVNAKSSKKVKRKSETSTDPADIYLGITEKGPNTYEVWAHEDCLVWSPGVHLIGPKLVGLEEAVWTCSNMSCTVCSLKGANIFCLRRGCLSATHLCCAQASAWQFDDENFRAYCPEHAR